MRRRRKGQAALEFLSTYGWAILIVLVMIGALSYFGVMNPRKYLPDRCIFKTGFECKDFAVQSAGVDGVGMDVKFTLQNGFGNSVDIGDGAVVVTYNGVDSSPCTVDGGGSDIVAPGEDIGFTCNFATGSPGVGQPVKTTIALTYKSVTGVYDQIAYGDLSTTVQ